MIVEAFLVCWNEISIMRLVVAHYAKFCDRITILDNHSTDGSQELAKELGCVVIPFGTKFFDDEENKNIKNNIWKGSSADWCIVADFDEILFSGLNEPAFNELMTLQQLTENGITIVNTIGWQIMSDEMPKDNLLEITTGYEFSNYAKNIVFNPQALSEINFNHGSHRINPVGNVVTNPLLSMYVLHYKHIGGVQRTIDRYKEYQPRMSKNNRKHGFGIHYSRTPASIREEWNERIAKSKPLI